MGAPPDIADMLDAIARSRRPVWGRRLTLAVDCVERAGVLCLSVLLSLVNPKRRHH